MRTKGLLNGVTFFLYWDIFDVWRCWSRSTNVIAIHVVHLPEMTPQKAMPAMKLEQLFDQSLTVEDFSLEDGTGSLNPDYASLFAGPSLIS